MKIHKRSLPETRKRLKLNWTLLGGSLLTLAILIPGGYFLHRSQMDRVKTTIKSRADKQAEQGDWLKSASTIQSFLLTEPDNREYKVKLAEVMDQSLPKKAGPEFSGQLNRIIALQYIALGICEPDPTFAERGRAIRKSLIGRLNQLGRFEDALNEISELAGPSTDPELLKDLALIRYSLSLENRTHSYSESRQSVIPEWLYSASNSQVVDLLQKALINNPGDIELSIAFARACIGQTDLISSSQLAGLTASDLRERAIATIDKMLASHREDMDAWAAHYEIVSGIDPLRAETDIRQLLSMAPENEMVLRYAGLHYLNRAKNASGANDSAKRLEWLSASVGYLRESLSKGSKSDYRTYLALGEGLEMIGSLEEAIQIWESGTRVSTPPTAILWSKLAQVWAGLKKNEKTLESLKSMDESIRNESNQLSKIGQSFLNRISKQQWASYYAQQGDYLQAANYLNAAVLNDQNLDATDRSEIYASIGQCYNRTGQFDLAVEAFQDALALKPSGEIFHRGMSEALAGSNRPREAIDQLGLIEEKTAQDHLMVCKLILQVQRWGQQDNNLWVLFDNSFKDASNLAASDVFLIERPWFLDIIQLDSASLRSPQGDAAEIELLLERRLIELSDRFPESFELQLLVVERLEKLGLTEKSRKLLAKIEQSKPKDVSIFLKKIDNLIKDGMGDEAKKMLASRLAIEPDNQALQSAATKISIGMINSNTDVELSGESVTKNINALIEAGKVLAANPILVPQGADETQVQEALNQWSSSLQVVEKQLRDREGAEGTDWQYLRGRRLLAESGLLGKDVLEEVEVIKNYLGRYRPNWNSTYVLSGMVEDYKGNPQSAIRDFSRAIRLGEDSIQVYERLAELMLSQGQVAELSSILDRLGDRRNRSQKLSSIALSISGKNQQSMLELAKEGTVARPKDPMAWVWLGQAIEFASRSLAADLRDQEVLKSNEAIQKGLGLASGKSLPVYNAAFGHYFSTKQNEKYDDLLKDLQASEIEPVSKQMTLATMYQALDRMESANAALLEARKFAKDFTEIDRRIAQLYVLQGRQEEAIGIFKALYDSATDSSGTARRSYVTLLANRGTDSDWQTIESIYENDKFSGDPDDKRLRAELLSRKGKPKDLAMAQYLLESLVEDPKQRSDQDRFRLASIYIVNSNLAKLQDPENPQVNQLLSLAGKQLLALTRNAQAPIEYLYTYGDFLVSQDRIVEANDIADRLAAQDPNHFATALLGARLQKISGNLQRAKSLILSWKDARLGELQQETDPSRKAEVLTRAGSALSELGADLESEELLRDAYELDATTGINYVRSLARSENEVAKEGAIRYLLDKLKKDKSAETAQLLAGLLSVGTVSVELSEQSDEVLTAIGGANDSNAELLLSIADMWLAQKKSTKAVEAYRKIIALKPNDVVALNNLAILLGEQPDGTIEALALIDQAMNIAGKQPLLLDSKAAILILASRVDEAIPILEIAASASNDPRILFHLYLALRRAARNEEADRLKAKISPTALRKSILTPDDQLELERFEQQDP